MNVQNIGISLQFTSFDFIYGVLYRKRMQKVKKDWRDKQITDKEFHAAIKLVHEVL